MSRIGYKKIEIPAGVKLDVKSDKIEVNGPKGKLDTPMFPGLLIEMEGNFIQLKRNTEEKSVKAKHGLVRALLMNNIIGISTGFTRTLILQGVGFRAQKKGEKLNMTLGYSHEINMDIPKDVKVECPEPTKVVVSGIDKQRVGQIAAVIRSYRPPEPYKGKGIRYDNEKVRRKAGKAGKK